MAIEYSLKIEKKLSESDLLEQLESIGYIDNDVIELPKGIEMSQFRSTLGLTLYLMESGEYPFNVYETQFSRNEFVYESTLSFRFVNNLYNNEAYEFVLSLVFNLMKNNNSNALFLSNGDNELCFFNKDCIYLENSSHVWDKVFFAEIHKGYKYFHFDGNYIF